MWLQNLSSALRNRREDTARFAVALGTVLLLMAGAWSFLSLEGWFFLSAGVGIGAVEFLSSRNNGRTAPFRNPYEDDDDDIPAEDVVVGSSRPVNLLHYNPWARNACLVIVAYYAFSWTLSMASVGSLCVLGGSVSRLKDCVAQRRADAKAHLGTFAYGTQQVSLLTDWKA